MLAKSDVLNPDEDNPDLLEFKDVFVLSRVKNISENPKRSDKIFTKPFPFHTIGDICKYHKEVGLDISPMRRTSDDMNALTTAIYENSSETEWENYKWIRLFWIPGIKGWTRRPYPDALLTNSWTSCADLFENADSTFGYRMKNVTMDHYFQGGKYLVLLK